jgi:hypothetical protein
MNILYFGEIVNDFCEFIVESILSEFDFPHVKASDTADFKVGSNYSRSLPLCFRQSDVDQVSSIRNPSDGLEVVIHLNIFINNYISIK